MSLRIRGGLALSVLFVIAIAASELIVADARTLDATLQSPQRPAAEQHCIGQAFKVGVARAATHTPSKCFPTFAEAIEAATAGAVKLAPDAKSNSLRSSPLQASSQTVIGIDYWDDNFQGSTYTWWVSNPNGCTDGSTYWNDVIPAEWQHNISSATTWAGCNHFKHYEGWYQTGVVIDCTCTTMGVMNDKTVSEFWNQ